MLYLWVKAAHVFAIIAWMAGLFYLPRLFIYHTQTTDSEGRTRFTTMEQKLYRLIMRPSMIASLVLGFWMLHLQPVWVKSGWFWVKFAVVIALLGYHHYCGAMIKRFADGNPQTERWFRVFNEVPAVALIVIVIMVIVKPF